MCYIEKQIAEYCDTTNESHCIECSANMYIEQVGGFEMLVCSECDFKLYVNKEEIL